jgi:hypothetical protein
MVPDPKTAQRERALHLANQVRISNATALRELRALPTDHGLHHAARIIETQPDHTGRLEIHALLRSIRRWGAAHVNALLRELQIHEMRKLTSLTPRQRNLLADRLRHAATVQTGRKAA